MKTSKLMLVMAAAAMTFAACNKQETTPVPSEPNTKSIVLDIANLKAPTKAPGTQIANGTQVTLNDCQVFFSDGTTLYTPYDETAENVVSTYMSTIADTTQFHFLDKKVNKVIVIGNIGEEFPVTDEVTTEAALWEAVNTLTAEGQQKENALVLYGQDSNLETTADHVGFEGQEDQHPSPVFKAVVNLMPTVARFEVTGYQYDQVAVAEGQTAPAREYKSITVTSQSLINFYEGATVTMAADAPVVTGTDPHALGNGPVEYTWDDVYQEYFTQLTAADKAAWYYDATAYELSATNNYVQTVATSTTAEDGTVTSDKKCYAYQVFPGKTPSFIFQLNAKDENNVTSLLYLQTKNLRGLPEGGPVAGHVYTMNVPFNDDNLRAAEKCIDVVITVHKWVVSVVTPEFTVPGTETPVDPAE